MSGAPQPIRLDESLFVEAAAGAGKTRFLVERMLEVLAAGAQPAQIAAMTFTHAAAGEMRFRLRQQLDSARRDQIDPARRAQLEMAVGRLEEAFLGTIHSFCATLLRERPVEAGVDPDFAELAGAELLRFERAAFRCWLESRLSEYSPVMRRALMRLSWREGWEPGTPMERLLEAARALYEWRDCRTPWRRDNWGREARIDHLVNRVRQSAHDKLRTLAPLRELVTRIDYAESAAPRDYDTLEALLCRLKRQADRAIQFRSSAVPKQSRGDWDALALEIEDFRIDAEADLAAALRDELWGFLESYDREKQRLGRLDFTDLLLRTRDLLRDHPEVLEHFQRRFRYLFVDEYQDTDEVQTEILRLLAGGRMHVVMVGDPKQSIYRFRGADVSVYERVRDDCDDRGVRRHELPDSLRSVEPIQSLVNIAFGASFENYVPLRNGREPIAGQPAVVVLPAPKPYNPYKITKKAIDECLPGTVAAFIRWLLDDSGWQVSNPADPSRTIPVSADHVCVLFRRMVNGREDVARRYAQALEAHEIPHLTVGSRSFHQREEIETLRAALNAIEWPDDELNVFATLRGSLFALPDELLLKWRDRNGRLNPLYPVPEDAELRPIAEARELLAELHRRRAHQPIAHTLQALLDRTRAHAGFAFRRNGAQALRNVYRLIDLARNYEASGGLSFRGFVEQLNDEADRIDNGDSPGTQEGSGVRLMTVHQAKGLEYPVVVLADLTCRLHGDPVRHVDRAAGLCATRLLNCAPRELTAQWDVELRHERAEGERVAYVAATRARDLLVITAVGDGPQPDSWLSPLDRAIFPARDQYRHSAPAPGCPAFGPTTVLARPDSYLQDDEPSVKPGLHWSRGGGNPVVWWDPATLPVIRAPQFGIAHQALLMKKSPGQVERQLQRLEQWKQARTAAISAGKQAQATVITAIDSHIADPVPVDIAQTQREPGRPTGRRFGTLVHLALKDVDPARPESAASLIEMHARRIGAGGRERRAAESAVRAALAHPLFQRARQSARMHREYPILFQTEEGVIVEGAVDMVFLEDGRWVLVDFKTDQDAETQTAYTRQLRAYAAALRAATGLDCRAYLLFV